MRKKGISIVLAILFLLTISACTSEKKLKNFELTVITNNGTGTGTVTSTPTGIDCGNNCTARYKEKTEVSLTANPNTDSSFNGWSLGCINPTITAVTNKTCTILMDRAKTITASFTKKTSKTYKLNIKIIANGVVSSKPAAVNCSEDCTAEFEEGSKFELNAKAAPGYIFVAWSGACSGKTDCLVELNKDIEVTAEFKKNSQNMLSLSVAITGNGSINSNPAGINNCTSNCSAEFTNNSTVTLTATPDIGWAFTSWTNCTTVTPTTCTTTMDTAKTITATFTSILPILHTLTVTKTGNGTVSSSPTGISCGTDCTEDIAEGTVVTLTATPDTNWSFVGWSSNCTTVIATTCKTTMDQAKIVVAHFESWPKLLGTSNSDGVNALATDSTGNVYLAGYTRGDLFGDSTYNGNADIFIVKY